MVVQSDIRNENVQSPDENDRRQRLRQRFEVVKKLGQGTYGKVQLAIDKDTKREVAIKTIKKAKIENEQDLVRIRREIQIMASIQHPHIIHIYEVFENSEKIVLVMQYASGGELYDYLGCHRKLPEKEARRLFRQIAAAIYYCHKNKICHRDLKLENILLDDKGNAKIADFGLSNLFDERKKLRTFCGSPLYASPEIVKGTPYCGPEVDCWSLGVLLYTLVYGAMPFDGRNFKRLVKQISEGDYFEPTIKSKASGIIRRLLTVDVTCRATIKDICLNEWVNEGYDHSLFKVANDMANLTPGSISSSHILTSSVSTAKNKNHQNVDKFTKNVPLNKYLTSYEQPTQDNFKATKYSVANNYTASSPYATVPPRQTISAINEVPCEVKFVMCSLLTAVERLVERQCRSMSKNMKSRNDETADKQCLKKECSERTNINTNVVNNNEINNQQNQAKNSDNKVLSPALLSDECQNEKKTNTIDSLDTDKIITSNETFISENICKTTEQIAKPQNIVTDQTQIKQKEVESILPIFDVTSIIPKRPSRKNKTNNKEKLIQNTEDVKQVKNTTETATVSNDLSKCLVYNHEGEIQNSQKHPVADAKKEKTDSTLSSASKHRNDVIDFINNILSRHKLSTQIVRHSDTDAKIETTKKDERLSHDNISTHKKQRPTNENTEEQIPSNQDSNESQKTYKFSTKISPESEMPTISASVTNNESLFQKMESHETTQTSKESKIITSNTDDEKRDHQPLVPSQTGSETIEPQRMVRNFKASESLKQETLEMKNNKRSNNITDGSCDSVLCPRIESVEQKVEHTVPQQRKSLRDSMSDKNTENENGKKQANAKKRLKNRSYSVDNDKKIGDLEKILRRPRKYSLCALLAASFEFDQMASKGTRKDSDASKKVPGKVEIPKPFDPTSEPDLHTPMDKKEIILIPSISVAENKQKMENEIEKVKMSALSMIMRKKSEACARRRMKKYARSYTDVLQRIEDMRGEALDLLQNCDQLDAENLNGDIDFIVNGDYKFGEELNLSECHWDVENFDYSQPLVAQGHEAYVPIRRCCKKIHFPPKATQNEEQTTEADNENEYFISYEQSDTKEQKTDSEMTEKYNSANSLTRKLLRKKHSSLSSVEDRRKNESKTKQSDETNAEEDEIRSTGQSESIYSSSFDRDSSDNDDDLDEIFGTKLDACGSEDLWQFLKSVNSDLSNHLRRIKHNKSLCSRSKSQECKTTVNPLTYEKLLTRSRSKEEKQNSQLTNGAPESLRDSCYCSLASDFNQAHCNGEHCDRENSIYSISMKNSQSLDGEFGSSEKDMHCNSQLNISESLREKYYSLSNLDDTHSFLYAQNFKQKQDPTKCKSWATVLDLGDVGESTEKREEISPSDARTQSLYGTMRPRYSSKSRRTQSQVVLNGNDTSQQTEHELLTNSSNKGYRNKEHSILMQNRASSEFNINSKDLTRNSESLHNLNFNASDKSPLTFSKSLGSKLNLESYNVSSDSLNKTTHKSKANDLKKRTRKVSFLDVSKPKTSNFGLESVAKAQKVLSTIDREVDNKPPDESGTLLQALKTQGYKNLISQRLQELEANEEPLNRRYTWACMRNFANYYPNSLQVGNGDIDLADYAQYLSWNQQLTGLTDSIGYEDESYDENLDIFNDPKMLSALYGINNYQKMDNYCRTLPNMWLYQNVNDFRSERNVSENFNTHDFENSLPYSAYNETYNYDLPDLTNRSSTLSPRKPNRIKKKIITEPEQNSSTSHEAGLQRKTTPSTIEKLSMKIKALKNRCTQKSFEDLSDTKDESIESVKNRELEHNNRVSSSSDAVDTEDPNESVSDRIWRKSFYSRFNDGLTTRQRRSMLMESDFSLDSLLSRPLKQRVNSEVKIDERKSKLRVPDTMPPREKKDTNHVEGNEGMDGYKTSEVLENDRNIPHSVDSKNAVTDQAEDR